MENVINVIAVMTLVAVVFAGALLKRYTRKTLSDMDGVGDVSTGQDSDIIAKF